MENTTPEKKQIVFSAIQPSGSITLGNYLGAVKNWVRMQDNPEYNCIYALADLHTITVRQEPAAFRKNIIDMYASIMACGVDVDKSAESSINSTTNDKEYIRSGRSSSKASNQRTFSISGDRYIGDEAQDFFMSKKYAVGQAAVCKYVYFCLLDGKGESGTVTISVDSDGGGAAGENSTISVSLSKTGAAPADFEWSSISGVYSVTLNANGGVIATGHDVTSYTTGTAVSLPTSDYVSREGYTFDAWYDQETMTTATTIASDATGDKVFIAKWTENI